MISKIISGGQSGADLAGLDAALAVGIATGGWMPLGYKTEDGAKPEYRQKYGLRDLATTSYPARTRRNVEEAHATLIFSGTSNLQGGSLLTRNICDELKKPVLGLMLPTLEWNNMLRMDLSQFLRKKAILVLNVAGSRESSAPGTYQATYVIMHDLLAYMREWERHRVK